MSRDRGDMILDRLGDLGRQLDEIRALAVATNGRVRALELWQARIQGAGWAIGRLPAIASALAAVASVVAIVVALAR